MRKGGGYADADLRIGAHATTTALTQIERARGLLETQALSEDWIRPMGGRSSSKRTIPLTSKERSPPVQAGDVAKHSYRRVETTTSRLGRRIE